MTRTPVEERLADTLREVADRLPDAAPLGALETPLDLAPRRRRGRLVALATAAAVVLAVAWAGVTLRDDEERRVLTSAPSSEAAVDGVVVASSAGVSLIADGEVTQVVDEPAAVAFALSEELIVFQSDPGGLEADSGPIRTWDAGDIGDVPSSNVAGSVALLDAQWIDGQPVALISEWRQGAGADDTFEELVTVDLRDGSRRVLVSRPAWESSTASARLLPDGDVIGLMGAAASIYAVRWSDGAEQWSTEAGIDTGLTFASHLDQHVVLGWGDEGQLWIRTLDPVTGALSTGAFVDATVAAGELRCRDWLDRTTLLCDVLDAEPLALSVDDGSTRRVGGTIDAAATRIRHEDQPTTTSSTTHFEDEAPTVGLGDERLDYAYTTDDQLWLLGVDGTAARTGERESLSPLAAPDGNRVAFAASCECVYWDPVDVHVSDGAVTRRTTYASLWSPNASMRAGVIPIDDDVPIEVTIVSDEDDAELHRVDLGRGFQVNELTWVQNDHLLASTDWPVDGTADPRSWIIDVTNGTATELNRDGALYVPAEQSAPDGRIAAVRRLDGATDFGWLSVDSDSLRFQPIAPLPADADGHSLDTGVGLYLDARSGVNTWLIGDGVDLFEIDAAGVLTYRATDIQSASAP